ncbi:MAG: bifunctional UDP-N-acetylglucosamine diphosphorylase/glucosamine-1-phosphate N-acetyltransferase GlmU [Alphaproteobacteria bacterium]|nr:bifunctional UDP-N-acetylglucosamine diphosphorylase/glucosamine-1-phosphate N-acetyltransferase GlmU [Alphaproteobacteria bacterium]
MTKASKPIACIILAAGQGTRMHSATPKVLHRVAGKPMLQHVIAAAAGLKPEKIVIVLAPGMDTVAKTVAPHAVAIQEKARGTGDAARAAKQLLKGFKGDVLVLFADTPLVTTASLQKLCQARDAAGAAVAVAGFRPADPAAYGRLICGESGALLRIVEALDAGPEEKAVRLCNGGIMLFAGEHVWRLIEAIGSENAKQEYYMTDAIALANEAGLSCAMAEFPVDEVMGINNRVDLAEAERLMQESLRKKAMEQGVTLTDPQTVYLSADTKFGRDVTVGPNVYFGPGVTVGNNVEIRPFCHLEGAVVSDGAVIGPFARLRPGATIGADAHIGNFVEIKNSEIGTGAKINHLSYIGDAEVGGKANIGAGTITCNYDGFRKHKTVVGDGAFIGSNTALVAPVEVGGGAFVGAGSVITENVPADTLAVARGRQVNLENWATRFRDAKKDTK